MMWDWITCGRYVLCVKPLWFDQPSPTTSIYHFVLIAFPLSLHPMSELDGGEAEVEEGKKLIQLEVQNSNGATTEIHIETMKWEWETTGLCSGVCALRMIGAVATSKSIRFEVLCDTSLWPRQIERESFTDYWELRCQYFHHLHLPMFCRRRCRCHHCPNQSESIDSHSFKWRLCRRASLDRGSTYTSRVHRAVQRAFHELAHFVENANDVDTTMNWLNRLCSWSNIKCSHKILWTLEAQASENNTNDTKRKFHVVERMANVWTTENRKTNFKPEIHIEIGLSRDYVARLGCVRPTTIFSVQTSIVSCASDGSLSLFPEPFQSVCVYARRNRRQ